MRILLSHKKDPSLNFETNLESLIYKDEDYFVRAKDLIKIIVIASNLAGKPCNEMNECLTCRVIHHANCIVLYNTFYVCPRLDIKLDGFDYYSVKSVLRHFKFEINPNTRLIMELDEHLDEHNEDACLN